jgi:hypothetical protein
MTRIVVGSLATGIAAAAVLILWRGFFWQHAALIGLGVAALVYTGFRTYQNLKDLHRH